MDIVGLLNSYGIYNYKITEKSAGNDNKGPLTLIEVYDSRFILDQCDFHNLRYTLIFRSIK